MADKRIVFDDLFSEFIDSYPQTEEGQWHIELYSRSGKEARKNYEKARSMPDGEEDTTEFILTHLLPYQDTEPNQSRDVWIHVAPMFAKKLRPYFEKSGYVEPDDWPVIARKMLSFVERCVENPEELQEACEEFDREVPAKGIQAAMMTPILNALRPKEFVIWNGKPRDVVEYFIGKKHSTGITEYPSANQTTLALIDSMSDTMRAPQVEDIEHTHTFDMFCHWLIAEKPGFPPPEREKRFWLVAPGRGARLWEEMHAEGIIALGWDKIGDYAQYEDRSDFQEAIAEANESDGDPKNSAKACYEFIYEMQIGDVVIAKQGQSRLLGYGIVESDYRYEESRQRYKHVRDVRWAEKGEWELPDDHKLLPNKTLTPRTEDEANEYCQIMEEEPPEILRWSAIEADLSCDFEQDFEITGLHFPREQKENLEANITKSLRIGKHIILTGPPGTGKSKLAKEICRFYREEGDFTMNTATSDWSTFDTIGGYRPEEDGSLAFRSGLFLKCFKDQTSCRPRNRWLILDEINRADIDKAFGSLFSALTGDNISIPFEVAGETIEVVGDPRPQVAMANNRFVIHPDWRIIATMNTFDKASLYEMSYAFMRRFAFVPVGIPQEINSDLIEGYLEVWNSGDEAVGLGAEDWATRRLPDLWRTINDTRPIGPAVIRDIYQYVSMGGSVVNALIMFVLPQFEGLLDDTIVKFTRTVDEYVEGGGELRSFCVDFFGIAEDRFGENQ